MWPNDDRTVLLCESSETLPELRWRPRSNRIGRNRQIVDQSGLDVLLLLTQLLSAFEGAQLVAERPCGRTGTRQPHVSRVDPRGAQRTDGTDHKTSTRLLRKETTRGRCEPALELALFFPYLYMPDGCVKSKKDLRNSA